MISTFVKSSLDIISLYIFQHPIKGGYNVCVRSGDFVVLTSVNISDIRFNPDGDMLHFSRYNYANDYSIGTMALMPSTFKTVFLDGDTLRIELGVFV